MPYSLIPLQLLIVEDNPGDFILFEAYLRQSKIKIKNLFHAPTLEAAQQFSHHEIDIAFLDLTLPDSRGIDSFKKLYQLIPKVPIVVLSGLSDETIAIDCISLGAQDYLLKDEMNKKQLEKSIQYSIERKKNLENIKISYERYEYASRASFDVIWDCDFNTNEIYWNDSYEKKFGYKLDGRKSSIEQSLEYVYPLDKVKIKKEVKEVIENPLSTIWSGEYRYIKANGIVALLSVSGIVIRNESGKAYRMVGTLHDITEKRNLEQKVLEREILYLKQFTEAAIIGQEKEKEQIGKELHDNINQILASVKLYLEIARTNDELRSDMIERSRDNVIYALDEIRKLSHSLVPPSLGDHGLVDSLKELLEELNSVGLFKSYLTIEEFDETKLDENKKLMLYRIIQEQINNIIKYSKAKEIYITFKMPDNALLLTITDDGIGFDPTAKSRGIGLRNIDNRLSYYSGNMQIISAPGAGTSLEVNLPV